MARLRTHASLEGASMKGLESTLVNFAHLPWGSPKWPAGCLPTPAFVYFPDENKGKDNLVNSLPCQGLASSSGAANHPPLFGPGRASNVSSEGTLNLGQAWASD